MAKSTREILDAALVEIGEADLQAFLKWVTPELIEPRTSVSSSTVRRTFARIGGFDRGALTDALMERALDRDRVLVKRSCEAYMEVANSLDRAGAVARMVAAVTADLDAYFPGMDAESDVTGEERILILANATCDRGGRVARLLRERQEENLRLRVPVYEAFLARTHRRLAPDVTIERLATWISTLLDGAALRRRCEPQFDVESLTRALLQVFWSSTVGLDGEERDVIAELVRDLDLRDDEAR